MNLYLDMYNAHEAIRKIDLESQRPPKRVVEDKFITLEPGHCLPTSAGEEKGDFKYVRRI